MQAKTLFLSKKICIFQIFVVILQRKIERKEQTMPMTIPVTVDVPPRFHMNQSTLEHQLSLMAQVWINQQIEEVNVLTPTMTEEEYAHCISVDECIERLRQRVHQHYHPEVCA